jgi:ubiquinone biosynthesis protein Coq4
LNKHPGKGDSIPGDQGKVKMKEDQLSKKAFIGFRVHPLIKSELLEEAIKRGVTLSDLVTECIEIAWEKLLAEDVKQESKKESVKTEDC